MHHVAIVLWIESGVIDDAFPRNPSPLCFRDETFADGNACRICHLSLRKAEFVGSKLTPDSVEDHNLTIHAVEGLGTAVINKSRSAIATAGVSTASTFQ